MKQLTKEYITNRAENILKQYSNAMYPIAIVDIAEKLGLIVKKAQFSKTDIAGMLNRQDKTIYVAESDNMGRRRFSIAHEIGHYVLHEDEKYISYRDNISTLGFDIKEVEANFFAANLLMPEKEIKALYNANYTLENMSHYFAVSRAAVGFRLKSLGLDNE